MTAVSSFNPFAFGSDSDTHGIARGAGGSDRDDREYAIVRRQGASAPEVDRDDAEVLEVTVRWGRTILGVAYVAQGASLSIGEEDSGAIMVPASFLGAASYQLIDRGTVMVPEQGAQTLTMGQKLRFSLGLDADKSITVQVARVAAAKKPSLWGSRENRLKTGIFAIVLGSFAAHLAVVTALAFSPGLSLDDDNAPLDKETSAHMLSMYKSADMHETPQQEETVASKTANAGGEDGQAHQGPPGQMGALNAPKNGGAYSIKGPADTKEETLAKTRALINSGDYGALGAMRSVFGTSVGPTDMASAFDTQIGRDPADHEGNLLGDKPGDSFGYNGLGLMGTGWGGDGFGGGIGLGTVAGFGHGPGNGGTSFGNCLGDAPCGTEFGPTISGKKHVPNGVGILDLGSNVEGSLPQEVVRRIVRANFPRFRACYDQGLKNDPGLKGTVSTRFIIDQTGAVETATLVSSTLSNNNVSSCVVGVFSTLSFPSPENGKARVVYPIDFQTSE